MARGSAEPGLPAPADDDAVRRKAIIREIQRISEQIARLESGELTPIIEEQPAAPSCTICEQLPPGKLGQPTDTAEQVRSLRRQLAELESQLAIPGPVLHLERKD